MSISCLHFINLGIIFLNYDKILFLIFINDDKWLHYMTNIMHIVNLNRKFIACKVKCL